MLRGCAACLAWAVSACAEAEEPVDCPDEEFVACEEAAVEARLTCEASCEPGACGGFLCELECFNTGSWALLDCVIGSGAWCEGTRLLDESNCILACLSPFADCATEAADEAMCLECDDQARTCVDAC